MKAFPYTLSRLLLTLCMLSVVASIGCYPGGGLLKISVTLSPEQLVPPITRNTSSGSGTITIDRNNGLVTGQFIVSGFTPTAMHIHSGYAGEVGGFTVTMDPDAIDQNTFHIPPKTRLSVAKTNQLLAGGMYINSHSNANPAGEARGQIIPPHISVFWPTLRASEVVPPTLTSAIAHAALTLNRSSHIIRGNVRLSGLTPSAVNLKRGYAGENGLVVFALQADALDARLYRFPSFALLSSNDFIDFMNGGMYLNADNDDISSVIRGQIIPENIKMFIHNLDGSQTVPPTQTNAFARSYITANLSVKSLVGSVHITGMIPTATHLHAGVAGLTGEIISDYVQDSSLQNLFRIPPDTVFSTANFDELLSGNTYVNVHSATFPDGEIRGQVH